MCVEDRWWPQRKRIAKSLRSVSGHFGIKRRQASILQCNEDCRRFLAHPADQNRSGQKARKQRSTCQESLRIDIRVINCLPPFLQSSHDVRNCQMQLKAMKSQRKALLRLLRSFPPLSSDAVLSQIFEQIGSKPGFRCHLFQRLSSSSRIHV